MTQMTMTLQIAMMRTCPVWTRRLERKWKNIEQEETKHMYILKLKAVTEKCTYESVAIFKSIASAPNSWPISPLKGNMHGLV